jgi:hypothetical protein
MRNFEYLLRALAKLIDLTLNTHLLDRITDAFYIDHSLISKGMEQVEGFDSLLSSLLVAENQIDPFVKIF